MTGYALGLLAAPTFPRAGGWRRRFAVLGILALLFQCLVPLVHRPAAAPSPEAWAAGAICRGGLADAGGKPEPTDQAPPQKDVCPICLVLQLCGAALLPVAVALCAFSAGPRRLGRAPIARIISCWTVSSSLARAPPLTA